MENLLSKLIDRQDKSNNDIIESCGIDRSTFFKIKKGIRVAKEEQFCTIVNQLSLSPEEKRELIEEYEYVRYWQTEGWDSLVAARRFLRYLCDHSAESIVRVNEELVSERKRIMPDQILYFFRKEAERDHGDEIWMFLSSGALDVFDWHALIPLLQESSREWNVNIMLSSNSDEQPYDPVRKFERVQICFDIMEQTGIDLNIYRDVSAVNIEKSEPYPFWIIGENRMILIERNLEECLQINRETVISKYRQVCQERAEQAYEILKRYSHLQEIITEMISKCEWVMENRKKMYVMSGIPCAVLYVQQEQIRRYCPEKLARLLIEYQNHFSAAVSCEYATRSGFEIIKKNRVIPEWDCKLQFPEEELKVFETEIWKRAEDHRILFLSRDAGYAPDGYSIALFEDMEINVQSLSDPSLFIQIREKALVEALQKWFSYRRNIVEIEKELGME